MPIMVPIAGEWNEKPVMCADEEETFEAIFRNKSITMKIVRF